MYNNAPYCEQKLTIDMFLSVVLIHKDFLVTWLDE